MYDDINARLHRGQKEFFMFDLLHYVIAFIMWHWNRRILEELGQCHSCWSRLLASPCQPSVVVFVTLDKRVLFEMDMFKRIKSVLRGLDHDVSEYINFTLSIRVRHLVAWYDARSDSHFTYQLHRYVTWSKDTVLVILNFRRLISTCNHFYHDQTSTLYIDSANLMEKYIYSDPNNHSSLA